MFRTSPVDANGVNHGPSIATILESFPANIAYVDTDLVYRFVNARYETYYGRARGDVVGRQVAEVLGPDAYAVAVPYLRRALGGECCSYEAEFRIPGCSPGWLAAHYVPDVAPAGGVRGIFVFALDVSRRHRAERELQESEARFRLLYDHVPIGIGYYDRDCRLVNLNRRGESELGTVAATAIGRTLVEILGEDVGGPFMQRQREVLAGGKVQEHIDEIDLEGGHRWYLSSYAPVPGPDGEVNGVQIVSGDITALKLAEQANLDAENRLRRSQKLQAMGLLAGGVAHDFNNILQTVLSFTGEMLDDAAIATQHREDLGVVRDACRRGASLTAQLLAFSRRQCLQPEVLDAHEAVASVFKMIRRLIGEDIELTLDLAARRSCIRADEGQLAQILLNLAVNARDAMPDGGRLAVSTTTRSITAGTAAELQAGEYLVIGVRDTGCGISPENLERVFEPFFTTKAVGQGTGLGLATVFGIAKQHGGHVEVTSRPGEGAHFEVLLPLHAEPAFEAGASAKSVSGGDEAILLAEDDPEVRALLARRLVRAGYRVLQAADGDEAVAVHRAHADIIRLAVLDVVMPGCGGRQAYETMHALQPTLPVVFLSGYPLDRDDGQPVWDPALPLLRKPVAGDELCREVRRQLDRRCVPA